MKILMYFILFAASSIAAVEDEIPKIVNDQLDQIFPNIEKAKTEYAKKVKAENDKLCKVIESAMSKETKAGNLDNAMALKNALEKAKAGEYITDLLNPPVNDLLNGGSKAPSDSVEFKGLRYKFFDESISFVDAEMRCEKMGGRLVVIMNNGINSFVFKLTNGSKSWIGLKRVDGSWLLSNGKPASFTKWKSGQPNNGNEIYGGISYQGTAEWEDYGGTFTQGFVCEWK